MTTAIKAYASLVNRYHMKIPAHCYLTPAHCKENTMLLEQILVILTIIGVVSSIPIRRRRTSESELDTELTAFFPAALPDHEAVGDLSSLLDLLEQEAQLQTGVCYPKFRRNNSWLKSEEI